jgi:hypothetical protein
MSRCVTLPLNFDPRVFFLDRSVQCCRTKQWLVSAIFSSVNPFVPCAEYPHGIALRNAALLIIQHMRPYALHYPLGVARLGAWHPARLGAWHPS